MQIGIAFNRLKKFSAILTKVTLQEITDQFVKMKKKHTETEMKWQHPNNKIEKKTKKK